MPDEIDVDLAAVEAVIRELATLAEEIGPNATNPFGDPRMVERIRELNTAEFQAAQERIDAFLAQACLDTSP